MSLLNKNPKRNILKQGKGLMRNVTNNAIVRARKNTIGKNNVFIVPRKNRYGQLINNEYTPISNSNRLNMQSMRRK